MVPLLHTLHFIIATVHCGQIHKIFHAMIVEPLLAKKHRIDFKASLEDSLAIIQGNYSSSFYLLVMTVAATT